MDGGPAFAVVRVVVVVCGVVVVDFVVVLAVVAFVVDVPSSPLDSSAALPVQVYLWADAPERGFVERTSAAILVLLFFLLLMNSTAIWLRNKFETKW